jgi:hypothetical protein
MAVVLSFQETITDSKNRERTTMMSNNELESFFGDNVIVCTQQDLIDDGALVDITTTAKENGFVIPVAVTLALFKRLEVTSFDESIGQSLDARVHDLCFVSRYWIQFGRNNPSRIPSSIVVIRARNDGSTRQTTLNFDICMSFTTGGAPAITFAMPGED